MIEPTDAMRDTLWRYLPTEVTDFCEPDDILPWIEALLAAVERDRCLEPRDHVFHPLDRYRAPSKWPARRGALHPHFCVVCSDGEAKGPGCVNCRSTGFDQSPWPDCVPCEAAPGGAP